MKRFKLVIAVVLAMVLALVSLGSATANTTDKPSLLPSDAYLSSPTFMKNFGPGQIDSVLDLQMRGVGFALSGLTNSGTGISDNFWNYGAPGLDPLSGLALNGGFYSDATAYGSLALRFYNMGQQAVWVNVYMNTGFTDPPFGTPQEDTYWEARDWVRVAPGGTAKVRLEFQWAKAWNISDDPVYTGITDGSVHSVFRLDEVTNIGFQVADFDYSSGPGTETWLVVGSELF